MRNPGLNRRAIAKGPALTAESSGAINGLLPLWERLPAENRRRLAQQIARIFQCLQPLSPQSEGTIVLTMTSLADERITTAHRAKLASVYVRQASPAQVRHHQESTKLQYRLIERAVLFGWSGERVHVIHDDLGKSGALSSERRGFQTLIAEVGLGKAGLVMSLDASRLAATTGTGIWNCARSSAC
jgi:hypothetical protein